MSTLPQNNLTYKNAFNIIYKAVDKANQNGLYNLQNSYALFMSLNKLEELINTIEPTLQQTQQKQPQPQQKQPQQTQQTQTQQKQPQQPQQTQQTQNVTKNISKEIYKRKVNNLPTMKIVPE
jgi:hypothetical protein